MEFLVELDLMIPDETPEPEVERGLRAEAAAAARLAIEGHLIRLWRPLAGPESTVLGLYQADSETELDALLEALPLAGWLHTAVTPLAPHPNDPAQKSAARAAAGSP